MAHPVDIKDRTPNQDLIQQLENMLKDAKSGRIRSVIAICGWDDDCVSHSWVKDHRSSDRRLLAELAITQHEFITGIGLREGDSLLAEELYN